MPLVNRTVKNLSKKLVARLHGQMYLTMKNLAMRLVRYLHEQGNLSYGIVIGNWPCNLGFSIEEFTKDEGG